MVKHKHKAMVRARHRKASCQLRNSDGNSCSKRVPPLHITKARSQERATASLSSSPVQPLLLHSHPNIHLPCTCPSHKAIRLTDSMLNNNTHSLNLLVLSDLCKICIQGCSLPTQQAGSRNNNNSIACLRRCRSPVQPAPLRSIRRLTPRFIPVIMSRRTRTSYRHGTLTNGNSLIMQYRSFSMPGRRQGRERSCLCLVI